jgi:dynein heavy chain
MSSFTGIVGAFIHNSKEWKRWFMSATPESDALPGEWEQKCNLLRKMILLKAIRPDRVLFSASAFIIDKIGDYFVNPPPVAYDKIYEDSNKINPIIFILAPGVDPYT